MAKSDWHKVDGQWVRKGVPAPARASKRAARAPRAARAARMPSRASDAADRDTLARSAAVDRERADIEQGRVIVPGFERRYYAFTLNTAGARVARSAWSLHSLDEQFRHGEEFDAIRGGPPGATVIEQTTPLTADEKREWREIQERNQYGGEYDNPRRNRSRRRSRSRRRR